MSGPTSKSKGKTKTVQVSVKHPNNTDHAKIQGTVIDRNNFLSVQCIISKMYARNVKVNDQYLSVSVNKSGMMVQDQTNWCEIISEDLPCKD